MQRSRVCHIAAALLLLIACSAHAGEQHAVVGKRGPISAPAAKQPVHRIVWWPAELPALPMSHGVHAARMEALHASHASDVELGFDARRGLFRTDEWRREAVQMSLAKSRFRVRLRENLNLQCDLEQQRALASRDVFALKLALQFHFR